MSSNAEELAEGLVTSCSHGDVATLQQIFTEYPDIDVHYSTDGGITLLMHAIIGAGTEVNPGGYYLETCQLLVQNGVHLETADLTYGRTAAHWATYYHRDDILKELIIAGSDMTCPDFSGTSPFHLAIQEEALQCLSQCLRFLPKEILDIPDSQARLPLHQAVVVGSLEACQLLISADANVNQPQETTGQTPLHLAAELGQGPILELFLRHGGLLDIFDSSGLTPLHLAAVCDSVEGGLGAVVRVVGGGAVLDVRDERGMTPLMQACAYGSENNVRFLIKKKVDVLAQDSIEGKTCLHWAAGSDTTSAACVELIVKKYRNLLETKDNFGRTPLHTCATSGGVEALQVLVSVGCKVDSVDADERTAVHWATVSGNYPILPSLLEIGCPLNSGDINGATPIHYAVQHTGEPEQDVEPEVYEQALNQCKNVQACLAVLLDKGAKVNTADQQGIHPLHLAAQYPNNLEACSALLTKGADPNAKDNLGMTAFHSAAQRGIADNCQFLLEHTSGLHGNDVDGDGQTALHHAVTSESVECVERLLQCGLTVNQSDQEMRTPMHVAATIGSLDLVELLESYGSDLSMTSVHGALAMHEAAANGHTDVLVHLLVNGSPVDYPAGQSSATALHYAVAGGHIDCVQTLLEHNASINAIATNEQNDRLTPLDFCPEGNVEIADLLTSLGGVFGEEAVMDKDKEDIQTEMELGVDEPEPEQVKTETPEPDTISVRSIRPHTPTRPSQESGPEFEPPLETPLPGGVVSPSRPIGTPPPKKANLLKRALSVLKREKKMDSILSSTVGLYAAHATMLAAIVIGTPLGDKTLEISHKVATDTAEELKKAAATFDDQELPDLVWLREEVVPTPSPPPSLPKHTPTPAPLTPPPVEIKEDPYERRMRKAKAQLDQRKSPGYLAVEELVKAQNTHTRLKRQFQNDKLRDDIIAMKQEFRREEEMAKQASEKVLRRLADRMNKAEEMSQQMHASIDDQLREAHNENEKLSTIMAHMGVSSRPTVSQWIKKKDDQKKALLQDTLVSWDRTKKERNTAILLQQAITSQRALKHAAWGAKKDISARIRALREVYNPSTVVPRSTKVSPTANLSTKGLRMPPDRKKHTPKPVKERSKFTSKRSKVTPISSGSSVRATPTGFFSMRDTPTSDDTLSHATPPNVDRVWTAGKDYVDGRSVKVPLPPTQSFVRATGPKTVHAERTLTFISPDEYKAKKAEQRLVEKQLRQHYGMQGQRSRAKTCVSITSSEFEKPRYHKRRSSYSEPQYHSLVGDSLPRQHPPNNVPILPMTVLDPRKSLPVTT